MRALPDRSKERYLGSAPMLWRWSANDFKKVAVPGR